MQEKKTFSSSSFEEIDELKAKIDELNEKKYKMNEKKYNGWLISNNIMKRSIAVFGHYLLGSFIFAIIGGGIALLFIILFFLLAKLFATQIF